MPRRSCCSVNANRERLEQDGGWDNRLVHHHRRYAAAAHVEFAARYHQAMDDGAISLEELAVLVQLDEPFNGRFEEYSDTVNQVADLAGTVAAVVVAVVGALDHHDGLTLRFGPRTSDGDLAAHVEWLATIPRGGSLLTRVHSLIAESPMAPLGTRSGNAAQELPKAEQMIQDRLRQLCAGD